MTDADLQALEAAARAAIVCSALDVVFTFADAASPSAVLALLARLRRAEAALLVMARGDLPPDYANTGNGYRAFAQDALEGRSDAG